MKKKEFKKKLSLNKQNVSKLNQDEMSNLNGGQMAAASLPLCMDTVGPSNGCPPDDPCTCSGKISPHCC